jgi:hypothetical protein
MHLLITIDTEEDDAWGGRTPISTENVLQIPRFQALAERYGFKPTWLCTEPVLLDPRLHDALIKPVEAGRAEIGAHLHPWSCGPFPGGVVPDQGVHVYPHELGAEEFRAKLERIAQLITREFGHQPTSYRAGRWGFRADQIPHLLEQGIRVDCSVTPHISWKRHGGLPGGNGGPDFRAAPAHPYWLDPRDVRRPGLSEMLELPMTILYAGGALRRWPSWWGVVDRLRHTPAGRALRAVGWAPVMFRPWPRVRLRQLLRMWRLADQLGFPYMMLMFHSSELMPGGSPYYPDGPSVERLYMVLTGLFESLHGHGVVGATLTEFALPYLEGRASAPGRGKAGTKAGGRTDG